MAKFGATFKLDDGKAADGVWFQHDTEDGPIKLLVASINSPKYRRALQAAMRQYKRAVRSMDMGKMEEVTKRVMAKHILLGWENLEDDAGNAIPYSAETAYDMFNESQPFFDLVSEMSADEQRFKCIADEDATGN